MHELALNEGRLRKLRPIHVFTHLAQYLARKDKDKIFGYCYALENKLFGVRYHQFELRKAIAEFYDLIYVESYLRDYDDQQKVICSLEAYLNSIYSALEIASLINKKLHPDLPQGFKKQSKKFDLFAFSKWEWLPYFYDIRTELEHFGTSLPQMSEGNLIIDIARPGKKYILKPGKSRIPLTSIFNFSIDLFRMLDEWAKHELKKIDPEITIVTHIETGWNLPLKTKTIKVKKILDLIKEHKIRQATNQIKGGEMAKKKTARKIGRDAATGRFIPVKEAERRKSTAIVETIKPKKKKR